MKRRTSVLSAVAVVLLLATSGAFAQEFRGAITGTVADATGALPAVLVHAEQSARLCRHLPATLCQRRRRMDKVYPRCAGLDIHKDSVWAAARVDGRQSIEKFGTTSAQLLRLGDWLANRFATSVATIVIATKIATKLLDTTSCQYLT